MIHITFSPFDLKPGRRETIMSILALDLAERQREGHGGRYLTPLEIAEIAVLSRQLEEYKKAKGVT
jgi:hypothetical protein